MPHADFGDVHVQLPTEAFTAGDLKATLGQASSQLRKDGLDL